MLDRTIRFCTAALVALPLLCSTPVLAQYDHHGNFYNGVREGGRSDSYNNGNDYGRQAYGQQGYRQQDPNHGDYGNNRGYDDRGHGIGTGKGALIGGAGGAVLGAVFGGGLKGSLIGGAAGAGIGAVAGHAHEEHQENNYYERR